MPHTSKKSSRRPKKLSYMKKLIQDTEPQGTFTFVRSGAEAFIIMESKEQVRYNPHTCWLQILDEDGFWVDKYKPIYRADGSLETYEDYYSDFKS